jgi:hypothetical protein
MDVRPASEWNRPVRTDDVIPLQVNGAPFKVTWNVIEADEGAGRLHVGIHLPLGVFNDETISVVPWRDDEILIRFY